MKVNIPKNFFLKEAKHEYWDYKSRLICEVIQNSHDAGSTQIDLIFDDDSMTFIDNGRGITKKRMQEALLTMGGSDKESGNTGGFGAAKKLLLFSHDKYEIHSRKTHVEGSVLEYKFVEGEPVEGTKIKIWPLADFNYSKSEMIYHAKAFLKKCNLQNCKVYINSELFEEYLDLPKVRETDIMSVHSEDGDGTSNNVYVRKNGLYMFSRYVTDLKQSVVCEIKQDSKDAFSQSRDSLKGAAYTEFSSMVDELNVDKMSFKVKGIKKRLFRGKKSFVSFVRSVIDKPSEIFAQEEKQQLAAVIAKVPQKQLEVAQTGEEVFALAKTYNVPVEEEFAAKIAEEYHKEEKANIEFDFLVDLCNSDYGEIPEEFHPEKLGFENKQIALLWKQCILAIANVCDFDLNFSIGFTLSNETEALYHRDESGRNFLLINPIKMSEKYVGMKERFTKTLLVAVHELVHLCCGKRYHDEEFALAFEEIATKVILNVDHINIYNKVEQDKI